MKIKFALFLIAIVFLFAGCSGLNVIPEKDLVTFPIKKVMELGAQNYSYYHLDEASYYYTEIGKIFTNDTPENIDGRAWAKYELGFIKYIEGRYSDADKYFDECLAMKLTLQAPQILAQEMKDKIKALKNKP